MKNLSASVVAHIVTACLCTNDLMCTVDTTDSTNGVMVHLYGGQHEKNIWNQGAEQPGNFEWSMMFFVDRDYGMGEFIYRLPPIFPVVSVAVTNEFHVSERNVNNTLDALRHYRNLTETQFQHQRLYEERCTHLSTALPEALEFASKVLRQLQIIEEA